MKRILIKQMRNEWRDNVWLVIALTVVSLAIWVLSINLWSEVGAMFLPLGYDNEDVYTLHVELIPEDSEEHIDYGENSEAMFREDKIHLMNQIRRNSNVMAAAWSRNAMPYDFSYYGTAIFLDDGKDTIGYSGNLRYASPEIAKVLRINSRSGKSPDELEAMLRNKNVLVSEFKRREHSLGSEQILGQTVILYGDSVNKFRVTDVIDNMRRSDYERPWAGTILMALDDNDPSDSWDIILRMKPGRDEEFKKEFDSSLAMREYRNTFLNSLTKMTDKRESLLSEQNSKVMLVSCLMLILLIVILLGMFGTFWFRVQQRVQEIAIRKVCGASKGDIFRRIIGEGLILLLIATIIAGVVFWIVYKFAFLSSIMNMNDTEVIIWAELSTCVIVGIGLVLSLWWPAYRSMKVEPAIAIKDE